MPKIKAKTAVINIKVDATLKSKAAKLAEQLGIPLSIVVQGGLRQFITKQGISFFSYQTTGDVAIVKDAHLNPSPYLRQAITEARQERAKGNNYTFNSAKEAINFLDKKRV